MEKNFLSIFVGAVLLSVRYLTRIFYFDILDFDIRERENATRDVQLMFDIFSIYPFS